MNKENKECEITPLLVLHQDFTITCADVFVGVRQALELSGSAVSGNLK